MNDLCQQAIRRRLEQVLIACFAACALFVVGMYGAALSTYTTGLLLTLSPTDRYPFPATMFLFALLVCIALVIVGAVRHWRWLFWFLLVAFGVSLLQIPAMILHLRGVVPDPFPAWYSLGRMGVALLELGLAAWMIQIYRHHGVWAMGKKKTSL